MTRHDARPSIWRPRTMLLIALAWALFGIWSASQYHLFNAASGRPMEAFLRPYTVFLASALFWAAATLAIVTFSRRFPIRGWRDWRYAALHALALLLVAAADVAFDMALQPLLGVHSTRTFVQNFLSQFNVNAFSFGIVVALTHAVDFLVAAERLRTREATLEGQLTRAQLEVLRLQLQPHFLFNTLNSISELVHHDPEAADRMVTGLGDLLRLSMDNATAQEITLRHELEFLSAYLEIQRLRFRDRLGVRVDVADETLDAYVPSLLLQPLVENAIKHGVAPMAKASSVSVTARTNGGALVIRIDDDGAGMSSERRSAPGGGMGLRNTRARLEQLYGTDHSLTLASTPGRGTTVTLRIPLRTTPSLSREAAELVESTPT